VLRGLAQVSLIDQGASGRYRMHDLVRRYAAERAGIELTRADRDSAWRRLAAFFLHTAKAGNQLLPPPRPPIELSLPAPEEPHPLADEAAAVAWFAAEHPCVLATQQLAAAQGWHRVVWQLAWALENFHDRRGHLHDDVVVWQAGLTAADHLADPAIQARAHRRLGRALTRVGRYTEAFDHLQQALRWSEHADDLLGQAAVHHNIGHSWWRRGDYERALEHNTHALRLFRRLDTPMGEARALNSVGWCHAQLGEYDQARVHCEAALALFSRHHDPEAEAAALDSLGYIAHHTGDHTQAIDYYQQALDLFRSLGDVYNKADTLEGLGHPLVALGRHEQARETWQQALELFVAQHRTAEADRVRQLLEQLPGA
jgi:tetratricopeptide (TPR) repeat protein